jgi:mono/diheme cytochrome c family protein
MRYLSDIFFALPLVPFGSFLFGETLVMAANDYSQNSYNKMGMFTFVASMVASLGVIIYVSFLSGGIDLKEVNEAKPGDKVPAATAPTNPAAAPAKDAPAAADPAKKDGAQNSSQKPWISTPESIAHGAELFAQNCVSCHGAKGEGNGPAGENLSPRPRNLVQGNWKYGGTRLGLMQVLANGSPGTAMQSYSYLAVNDRWSLVHFVRSITKNQIADTDTDVEALAKTLN